MPRLAAGNRNAALRFVTLIDALYEHRVKLVCSGAAEPGALYPEAAAHVARTVSRRHEMPSEAYLAAPHLT